MTDSEKRKHREKLHKLLALATGNTNKAEAMAAVEKARRYAAEYGLSLAEAEATKDFRDYREKAVYSGEKQFAFVDQYLWRTIANFCRCKVGTGRDEDGDLTIVFFGHDVDVELAHWLRATIRAAMAFEWQIYRDFVMGKGESVARAMTSFHMGMARELSDRMAVVENKDHFEGTSDSRALVVKKWELVNAAASAMGFQEAKGGRGRSVNIDGEAYGAGQSAGRRVDIGRGVGGNGGAKMIGKS